MSGVWVCPRNHSWRTQPADAEATLDVSQECPVCGEQGSWRSDVLTGIEAITARDAYRPTNVPGYEIHEELGRGAMGVVYRARDVQLNRTVALKMILAGSHAAPTDRARFRREVESVAALQHPNIVQIHAVGEVDGLPYCALEYVAGGTLSKRLKHGALPPMTAARLIRTLARATHYAHQNGIIHRDLKPGNVLLRNTSVESTDDRGSSLTTAPTVTSVDDLLPKIADFGLAKRLDSDMSLTGSSAVLGTPSNMAPEQADGRNRTVTAAADVYGLGTILYECLTGRPVFKASSPLETLHQVLNSDPPSLRSIDAKVPRDLETVCLKCLRKDPTQRYASAEELADDLGRFLAGEPVKARATGIVERTWRTARRQNALLLVIAFGGALAFGVVVALEMMGLLSGSSVAKTTVTKQPKSTTADSPEIKVLAVTAAGEAKGHGFLTSEKGVIQVSSDLLGMTEANSPRPKSLQVNIRSADGSETTHDAEVALVEPRFKLALVRLVSGHMPEPVKPVEPVDVKAVPAEKASPNEISVQALDRVKQATVALKWQREDDNNGVATGCFVDQAGTVITTLPGLGMDVAPMRPPDKIEAVYQGGTPQEQTIPARLLEFDRVTGLAAFHIELAKPVEPLAFGATGPIKDRQRLFVVAYPTAKASGMTSQIKIRETSVMGRIVTGQTDAVRYFQLEGGGTSGGFMIDTSGQVVGFAANGLPSANRYFMTPIELSREFLRGRVAEIVPGQPYEVQQRIEVLVDVKVTDPLRRVVKLALDVWTGPPGKMRPATSVAPVMNPADGPIVTSSLGAIADPDRSAGEPRRFGGAFELPTRTEAQVYWARARYFTIDGKERYGEAVMLPVSAPVKRQPANLGNRLFVPGESTVSLLTDDRTRVPGKDVFEQLSCIYHERWLERTLIGDKVAFRCTQFGDHTNRVIKQLLAQFIGLTGTVTVTSAGAADAKIDFTEATPASSRQRIEQMNARALESIYGFAIRSSDTEVRPDDSWTDQTKPGIAQLPNDKRPEFTTRYQYLGKRQTEGRDEAVVTWLGRTAAQSPSHAVLRGAAAVDLESGRIRVSWRSIESQFTSTVKSNTGEIKIPYVISLHQSFQRTFGPTESNASSKDFSLPGRAIEVVPFIGAPGAPQ